MKYIIFIRPFDQKNCYKTFGIDGQTGELLQENDVVDIETGYTSNNIIIHENYESGGPIYVLCTPHLERVRTMFEDINGAAASGQCVVRLDPQQAEQLRERHNIPVDFVGFQFHVILLRGTRNSDDLGPDDLINPNRSARTERPNTYEISTTPAYKMDDLEGNMEYDSNRLYYVGNCENCGREHHGWISGD
jgi:hypothetical protein